MNWFSLRYAHRFCSTQCCVCHPCGLALPSFTLVVIHMRMCKVLTVVLLLLVAPYFSSFLSVVHVRLSLPSPFPKLATCLFLPLPTVPLSHPQLFSLPCSFSPHSLYFLLSLHLHRSLFSFQTDLKHTQRSLQEKEDSLEELRQELKMANSLVSFLESKLVQSC